MSPAEWQKVKHIFQEAIERPPAERPAFLDEACDGDGAVRAEVESLLASHGPAQKFIEEPAVAAAVSVLPEGGRGIEAGHHIGPYRVVREAGPGGMGAVYVAERVDGLFDQTVAVKVLKRGMDTDAFLRRFAMERQILAALDHPNIARLLDGGTTDDGRPFFVMEYVRGIPLDDYCDQRTASVSERLETFLQICSAVSYAHQNLVVHLDLKPSNILVNENGTPKLLDFGIAKMLGQQGADATITEVGARPLTPRYASPEQLEGLPVTTLSDVYTLGVVLYELLTGHRPYRIKAVHGGGAMHLTRDREPERPSAVVTRAEEAEDEGGVTERVAPEETSRTREGSPERLRRRLRGDLDNIVLIAMREDPRERYGSVGELAEDIRRHLEGRPVRAHKASLAYRARKFVRRNRHPVAAAAIISAVVVGLVLFFTIRLATARNTALAAATRAQRIQHFMSSLFAGGDKLAGPSDELRVVTLIDRGVQQAQTLEREPEVQAELFHTLGTSYQNLGAFDRADPLLSSALDRRKMLLGPNHPQVAESLVALGLLRLDQARLDEAEQLVREGLDKARRLSPRDDSAVAGAATALGKVLTARGDYPNAIGSLEEGVRLLSETASQSPELAASLTQLVEARFYAGDYDIADALCRRALAINSQHFTDRHISVAKDLMNLAAIQIQRGQHKEAEQLYQRALGITQSWYHKDHPEVASNLTQLAQALTNQERYGEAEGLLRQAVAINERAYPQTHPRPAFALNELGSLMLERGRLDEAEALFLRVAELNRASYGDDHFRTITAMSNLGSIYWTQKNYPRAEQVLREVAERYAKISPEHLNTASARIKLGRTLVKLQRYQEAEAHLLAGYEIAVKQTDPAGGWLQYARKDLVVIYDALKEPEKAARFRVELAKYQGETPGTGQK